MTDFVQPIERFLPPRWYTHLRRFLPYSEEPFFFFSGRSAAQRRVTDISQTAKKPHRSCRAHRPNGVNLLHKYVLLRGGLRLENLPTLLGCFSRRFCFCFFSQSTPARATRQWKWVMGGGRRRGRQAKRDAVYYRCYCVGSRAPSYSTARSYIRVVEECRKGLGPVLYTYGPPRRP